VGNEIVMVVFAAVQKLEQGRGLWFKNSKLSGSGLISGLPCETAVERGSGWWWGGFYDAMVVAGNLRQGGGRWPRNQKLSMAAWFQVCHIKWWLWGSLYNAMVVVGYCVCHCKVGETPDMFEETGHTVCGKLTLICEMEELSEVDNINLLKVHSVTRKARSKNSDPFHDITERLINVNLEVLSDLTT